MSVLTPFCALYDVLLVWSGVGIDSLSSGKVLEMRLNLKGTREMNPRWHFAIKRTNEEP